MFPTPGVFFTSVAGCFAVSVSGLNEPSACCESHHAHGTSCIKTITLPQLLGQQTGQTDVLLQDDRIASGCRSKFNIQIKKFYYMYNFPLIYTFNAHQSETNATEKNSSTTMISQLTIHLYRILNNCDASFYNELLQTLSTYEQMTFSFR